jgi:hypothetical protein
MANFEVIYKIEVEAETALEAATVAETIMLSSVERPQFFVAKETKNRRFGKKIYIDLDEYSR